MKGKANEAIGETREHAGRAIGSVIGWFGFGSAWHQSGIVALAGGASWRTGSWWPRTGRTCRLQMSARGRALEAPPPGTPGPSRAAARIRASSTMSTTEAPVRPSELVVIGLLKDAQAAAASQRIRDICNETKPPITECHIATHLAFFGDVGLAFGGLVLFGEPRGGLHLLCTGVRGERREAESGEESRSAHERSSRRSSERHGQLPFSMWNSTRRLAARPSSVLLSAIGFSSP